MFERSFIVQGKSLEDALSKAAVVLHCAKERVAYEVLQDPRPGRYGQPGTLCKLRVTPVAPSVEEVEGNKALDDFGPDAPLPPSWVTLAALPSDVFLAKMEEAAGALASTPATLSAPAPPPENEAAPIRREVAGNVSLASGSIEHVGDVLIHGSVLKDMTVRATGSIHVVGCVETAFLDAGRDIIIEEGLFGTARSAFGAVRCRFAQGAQVRALRSDVAVEEAAMHCQIHAGRHATVGELLLGGTCYGEASVRVRVAGSESCVPTVMLSGQNRRLYDEIEHVRQRAVRGVQLLGEAEAVRKELLSSEEAGTPLPPADRARLWQAQARRLRLSAEIRQLAQQKSKLLGMINAERTSRVSISDRAYPLVRIGIDDAGLELQKMTQFATFTKDYEGGQLRMTPYN